MDLGARGPRRSSGNVGLGRLARDFRLGFGVILRTRHNPWNCLSVFPLGSCRSFFLPTSTENLATHAPDLEVLVTERSSFSSRKTTADQIDAKVLYGRPRRKRKKDAAAEDMARQEALGALKEQEPIPAQLCSSGECHPLCDNPSMCPADFCPCTLRPPVMGLSRVTVPDNKLITVASNGCEMYECENATLRLVGYPLRVL